jgi:putative endonuclease
LKIKLGAQGEETAARYLAGQGYKIVDRNFRCPLGEIDLIAKEGNTLCFIEVKARRSIRFGWPEESVTPFKQMRLRRLSQWYLKARRLPDAQVRFDVVSLLLGSSPTPDRIRLIKGAF